MHQQQQKQLARLVNVSAYYELQPIIREIKKAFPWF
jgi:hypothetical protein